MAKYVLSDIFEGDYPVTQTYGNNPGYYSQFNLAGHEGIDFGTPNGTPILAPFNGTILRDTFNDKDYGNFTVVWDKNQLCAVWFCHLQDVTTKVGDIVTKGQVIGHTDNTGNTTGPHLHFNFVETDTSGNRLNKDNGYQGFLNALDPNLVEWQLAGQQVNHPATNTSALGSLPANYDDIIRKSSLYDQFDAVGYPTVDSVRAIIDNITQARDNNQQVYEKEVETNKDLSSKNVDLTNSNTSLKLNISAVQKQNADLLQQLADLNKSDASAIDEGLKAEQALKEQTNDINKLATELDTTYPPILNLMTSVRDLKDAHDKQVQVNQNNLKRFQAFFTAFINGFFKRR